MSEPSWTIIGDGKAEWIFACDGCNKVSIGNPTCSVCGETFAFHGTPEGDKIMDEAVERLRQLVDSKK